MFPLLVTKQEGVRVGQERNSHVMKQNQPKIYKLYKDVQTSLNNNKKIYAMRGISEQKPN